MSNYAKIKQWDVANGEGIRTSIFFSGCEFHCRNCFNQDIWDFDVGEPFTREVYETKIKPTINEHIAGISILGGEPMHPRNIEATYRLVNWFKQDFPNKNIWVWSGYTMEDLMYFKPYTNGYQREYVSLALRNIDVLVDGQYIEEQRDLTLKWRGSKNQRVIDVQESLKKSEVVLYGNSNI